MMKKIISMAIAAAMTLSMAVTAMAEDNPKVYIDNTQISFADQEPVILGEGTTLVPARGVFEAMGAYVQWDGETRTVTVSSSDNIIRVFLNIDDPVMTVWKFTSIYHADETQVELAVAPQIINDRTMIPLRAISEAIGADVQWDGDAYSVLITTKDYKPYTPPEDPETPADKNIKTAMSLTSSVDSVSEGDTVDIYVNVANLPADSYLSGVTALVSYSTADFEYAGNSFYVNGEAVAPTIGANNPNYHDDAAKIAIVTLDDIITSSGAIAKLTFKALTANGGEFALVDSYDTSLGYDNVLTFTPQESFDAFDVFGEDLFVDTTPITVSGK